MISIYNFFAEKEHLSIMDMLIRGLIVFLLALVILRTAGKKTFGKRSPADNVVMIMLGAILSRAIVGSSPFIPVIVTAFGIVSLHRILSWLSLHSQVLSTMLKGKPVSLFKDGKHQFSSMKKNLISEADILEGIRIEVNADSLEGVAEVKLERNGTISVIKKELENTHDASNTTSNKKQD
jgi:uncharacterized membrane protein YcaP (DUF421 family)